MTNYAGKYDRIPVTDPFVLQVLDELIRLPSGFRREALRDREWCILPGVEQITAFESWLEEALQEYEVKRLLVLFKALDSDVITQAGWVGADREGLRFLDEAGDSVCYFATAPGKNIAWWQFYDDFYYLAGAESFITAALRNSFKTLVEYFLEQAREFENPKPDPFMMQFCREYAEFFPSGIGCDIDKLPNATTLRENLSPITARPPRICEEMILRKNGVRLLSKEALERRGWVCVLFALLPDFGRMSWARDAERIAWAISELQVSRLMAYAWDDHSDGVRRAYSAPLSRDSILAFRELCFERDLVVTSAAQEFVMLGSARQFFLVAGSHDFIAQAMGERRAPSAVCSDFELREVEESDPAVGDVLSEAMIGYLELFRVLG